MCELVLNKMEAIVGVMVNSLFAAGVNWSTKQGLLSTFCGYCKDGFLFGELTQKIKSDSGLAPASQLHWLGKCQ